LMHHLIHLLLHLTITHRIFIHCLHIKGVDNVEADALSRAAHHHSPTQQSQLSSLFYFLSSVKHASQQPEGLQQRHLPQFPWSLWP
jgi:hypothetical protein